MYWVLSNYVAQSFFLHPGEADYIAPFGVAYVKGWRRALACLICCEGVRSLGLELDELTSDFKVGAWNLLNAQHWAAIQFHPVISVVWFWTFRHPYSKIRSTFRSNFPDIECQASLRVIHCSVCNFATTKEAIFASRGESQKLFLAAYCLTLLGSLFFEHTFPTRKQTDMRAHTWFAEPQEPQCLTHQPDARQIVWISYAN